MKPATTTIITRLAVFFASAVLLSSVPGQEQDTNRVEADEPASGAVEAEKAAPAEATPAQPEASEGSSQQGRRFEWSYTSGRTHRQPLVRIGKDAVLKSGESAEAVVVIGGNAIIEGHVENSVVAVGGDILMKEGAETREAVAVLGGIKAEKGSTIENEAVAVGGTVQVADGADVNHVQDMDFGGLALPTPEWLRGWLKYCVLMLRPLSLRVGGVWVVAGVIFLLYLLVAAAFPRPVRLCVDELTRRPATTFALGLLTLLLLPLVILLLAVTGLGVFVIPFIVAAVALALIAGKTALLEWIGLSLGRPFRAPALENPLVALVAGTIILWIFYLIPVLGLLMLMATAVWGLGAAVAATFVGMKREMPAKRSVAPAPLSYSPPAMGTPQYYTHPVTDPTTPSATDAPTMAADAPGVASATATAEPPPAPGLLTPPVLPEVLSYPRAGFWERLAASFLDLVLVMILFRLVGGWPQGYLLILAYFAGMWAWKATTVGGAVLGLKVVRQDGQPITFAVALVRALAGTFSLVVLFLGFLWIAWDPGKEAWHDKIAGTAVIKLPRPVPLVCL